MTLSDSIVMHGTNAVLKYRDIAGITQINEVPEVFLGSFIARGLYEERRLNAHVERKYTTMARELKVPIDPEIKSIMGGHSADVAVYDSGLPTAIIEIKKYDEGGNKHLVLYDLNKMRELAKRAKLQMYVAVLVTDVRTGKLCKDRALDLGSFLGGKFDEQELVQRCGEGDSAWSWQFVCGSFT